MKPSASPKPCGVQVTAHSTAPASPVRSIRPLKADSVTVATPLVRSARKSARPLGKWNTASAGVWSWIRAGSQDHLICTPRNR